MTPSGVLDEIHALFSWNPPLLLLDPDKKPSSASRQPGFYDKHFSEPLVLKRVKPLPSLVPDLAKNVRKALDAASPHLPPLSSDFITAGQRKSELRRYARVAKDEKAIANLYDKYAANYCLSVASTLALHPTASISEWSSLLRWTQSVSSRGYAIMHGELHFERDLGFEEDIIALRAAIAETMEDDVRHIFTEMRDSKSPLATWEMKSLGAGLLEVMVAVPNLGTFSWPFCKASNCHKVSRHRLAMKRVAEVVVGPDAQNPPWSLPSTPEAGPSIDPPPPLGSDHGSLSPLTSLSTDNDDEYTKDRGMKRRRDVRSSPNHNAKKQKGDNDGENGERYDDEDEDEDEDEEYVDDAEQDNYQDQHDLTAHNLVQQAWAQATRVDGTVIVLHSGNHELVCVRHRASQTLYVSEVIEPHACINPAYGELQVAIYVAAIQDAMDRKQQPQPSPVSRGGALIGGSKGKNNSHASGSGRKGGPGPRGKPKVAKGDVFQGSAAEKGPTDDELAIENMIHEASNHDVVCMYLRYGVYDSPIPASFLRSAPPIMAYTRCPTPPLSPQSIRCRRPEECLTIILTSEIGRGATGVVHRGTLVPEIWHDSIPLDVVVKLAFDIEQRKALRSEYDVYRRMGLKGVNQGVTTALGFFDDSEDGACALVMLYAGVPLSTDCQGGLSISDCNAALSALESIHCAGILHGDIRPDNILVSDSGITIIDFGDSKKCDDKRAKDEELTQLRDLLGLAGLSQY